MNIVHRALNCEEMAGNDIGLWYRNIPDITRYWFTGSIVLPLAGRFGLLSFRSMALSYEFISHFHVSLQTIWSQRANFWTKAFTLSWLCHFLKIWRPFTSVLYYPITPATGFHFLIMLYFLYQYSTRLETGKLDFITVLAAHRNT